MKFQRAVQVVGRLLQTNPVATRKCIDQIVVTSDKEYIKLTTSVYTMYIAFYA